jgi:hypothetical protein
MKQIAVLIAVREVAAVKSSTSITLAFGPVTRLAGLVVQTPSGRDGVNVSGERIFRRVGLWRAEHAGSYSGNYQPGGGDRAIHEAHATRSHRRSGG